MGLLMKIIFTDMPINQNWSHFCLLLNSQKTWFNHVWTGTICTRKKYCMEEPIMTPCWVCYFKLCFLLFLFTERILFICNGLPQEPCPSAWMFSQMSLFRTLSTCEWLLEGRNQLIPSLRLAGPGETWKINSFFFFLTWSPYLSLPPFYKRIWQPDPKKLFILRHYSAIFLVCCLSEYSYTSCLNTVSWLIGLLCSEQSELQLEVTLLLSFSIWWCLCANSHLLLLLIRGTYGNQGTG